MTKFDESKAHYIAVTAIIIKDKKFLIVKRSENEKAFPGRWVVPGGKLERKDYEGRKRDTEPAWYNMLEGVVRREVLEETGLKIKGVRYLASLVYIRDDNIPTLVISTFADYKSGKVKLIPALTEYKWATLKEAKKYNLISGVWKELEMVDKVVKGKKVGEWK